MEKADYNHWLFTIRSLSHMFEPIKKLGDMHQSMLLFHLQRAALLSDPDIEEQTLAKLCETIIQSCLKVTINPQSASVTFALKENITSENDFVGALLSHTKCNQVIGTRMCEIFQCKPEPSSPAGIRDDKPCAYQNPKNTHSASHAKSEPEKPHVVEPKPEKSRALAPTHTCSKVWNGTGWSYTRSESIEVKTMAYLRRQGMDLIFPQEIHDQVLICILFAMKKLQTTTHRDLIDLIMYFKCMGVLPDESSITKTKIRGILALLKNADMLIPQMADEDKPVQLEMNPKIQTIVNLREAHDSHLEVCMAEIDPKFKREKWFHVLWDIFRDDIEDRIDSLEKFMLKVDAGYDANKLAWYVAEQEIVTAEARVEAEVMAAAKKIKTNFRPSTLPPIVTQQTISSNPETNRTPANSMANDDKRKDANATKLSGISQMANPPKSTPASALSATADPFYSAHSVSYSRGREAHRGILDNCQRPEIAPPFPSSVMPSAKQYTGQIASRWAPLSIHLQQSQTNPPRKLMPVHGNNIFANLLPPLEMLAPRMNQEPQSPLSCIGSSSLDSYNDSSKELGLFSALSRCPTPRCPTQHRSSADSDDLWPLHGCKTLSFDSEGLTSTSSSTIGEWTFTAPPPGREEIPEFPVYDLVQHREHEECNASKRIIPKLDGNAKLWGRLNEVVTEKIAKLPPLKDKRHETIAIDDDVRSVSPLLDFLELK